MVQSVHYVIYKVLSNQDWKVWSKQLFTFCPCYGPSHGYFNRFLLDSSLANADTKSYM